MNILNRYVYLNNEKYKASYSQSKQTGQIFFDVSVSAGTIKDLKQDSIEAINTCIKICNDANKNNQTKKKEKKTPSSNPPKETVRM